MKMFSARFAGIVFGLLFTAHAFASGAHYVNQKSAKLAATAPGFPVYITNNTSDNYTASISYYSYSDTTKAVSQTKTEVYSIYNNTSPYNKLEIDVNSPDSVTCITMTRDADGLSIISDHPCFVDPQSSQPDTITIGNPVAATASNKPLVKISH